MYGKKMLVTAVALVLALALIAEGKDGKKQPRRGMLESMQSVPCGVKERGLTGLGSVFGSVGVQHVNSNEKLCPQYLFRTDELDYHIRPLDTKHAVILPVGHEGEFKIKKDRLFLKVPDQDKKTRAYQVVSAEPVKSQGGESTAYRPADKPTESRPTDDRKAERVANQRTNPLPPPPQ